MLQGRNFVLSGGITTQACVHRKWHCFVENVFTDIENILIDQFAVVYFLYFCIWRGEGKFLIV